MLNDGVTTYGATATQECDPGYDLSGKSSIACGMNGSWSAQPVACSLKGTTKSFIYKKIQVERKTKIWYLYNQVPYLFQNTIYESDKEQENTRELKEACSFLAVEHNVTRNR